MKKFLRCWSTRELVLSSSVRFLLGVASPWRFDGEESQILYLKFRN